MEDINYYVVHEANNSLVYFQSGQYKGSNRLVAAYEVAHKGEVEAAVRCANNLLAAGVTIDDDYIFLDEGLGCIAPTYATGDKMSIRVLRDVYSEYTLEEEADAGKIKLFLDSKMSRPLGCGNSLYYDSNWIMLANIAPTSGGCKPLMLVCKKENMPQVEAIPTPALAEATL